MTADTDEIGTLEYAARLGAGSAPFEGRRPMTKACPHCPFVMDAAGADYLARGRLDGIKWAVLAGQPFYCHQTVVADPRTEVQTDPETGEEEAASYGPHYRVCAGAIAWARAWLKAHPDLAGELPQAGKSEIEAPICSASGE